MADATKPARRGRSRAQDKVDESTQALGEETTGQPEQSDDDGGDERREDQDGGRNTVTSELKDTIREAAIEVLRPVARKATTSAAKYAVTKGPDLVKDTVVPKLEEAGGAGALAKGALGKGGAVGGAVGGLAGKLTGKGGGGGKKPTGHGRGRRLPVQEYVDVAVDLETAYDQFTQFEDFPQFMHRVEKIEQRDDNTLMWHENIWGVRRSWEAEILEQKPCERIVWRSKGPTQSVGVVTFHRLSDQLTRVYMNFDFQPQGLFEKTASGFRMSRRALSSDLMRFKAWCEMRNDSTGAWRGVIEDGEVTDSSEGEEAEEGEEPRGEADEDFEEEGEDEDEEERKEERPRRQRRFARAEEEDDEETEEEEEEGEDAEPEAEADEDEAEEDEQPRRRPVRRRRPTTRRSAARG